MEEAAHVIVHSSVTNCVKLRSSLAGAKPHHMNLNRNYLYPPVQLQPLLVPIQPQKQPRFSLRTVA